MKITKETAKAQAEKIIKLSDLPENSLLYKMANSHIQRDGFYAFKRLTNKKVTNITENGIKTVKYTEVKTFVEA